jgi:SAM-dependent methyltransferase
MQQPQAYSGVENLEVMQEAINYNRYLIDTVRGSAPSRGRILDFGAGGGQFAAPLAALGLDITAVEPDSQLLRRLADRNVRAVPALGQLPDDSFEYIYTLNVLEHIDDDLGTLRQLHSKLKSGGRLLIYVPAFPVLYTSMDAKVGHVRRYTRQALVRRVAAAGFEIERVGYADSIGFFATLAFKLVGSSDGTVSLPALKLYDRLVFPISRALDMLARRWFGKNLLLIARKIQLEKAV